MKIDTLIEICNPLHVTNKVDGELSMCAIDSRKVDQNGVFIAIPGTEVDGHIFIEDAINRGAKVIICEESYYTDQDVCIIEVEDSRKLAGPVAQAFAGYPAQKMKLIGVTGTNGKTTTATLVYQVLTALGKKTSLLGTVHKRILDKVMESKLTTADPVELASDMKQMAEAGSEYLVMEVSSHALHQYRVHGLTFEVAAFTNLSHDHLDYHHTLEEYAAAKKMLFDHLPASSTAVVNMDDDFGATMLKNCKAKVLPLSFDEEQAYVLENTADGLSVIIDGEKIVSQLVGKFNAYNLGQTFLICKALGLSDAEIANALSKAKGAAGRMEPVTAEGDLPLVIVDYAHTPDALQNVLSTLSAVKDASQKLTVVFGAGGDRDTTKRPEMAKVAEEFADKIFVTSDNPRTENPDLIIADILNGFEKLEKVTSITDRKEAIERAIDDASTNEIILIAGKGHEDYQEVNGQRHHFDDREIARECLTKKAGRST
ncbi:UDP-N-acetylmuramoyl-L-alanyl-D-glutamate--2,6-diaminopimelate ligase [Gracilimonas mengyeensis]|uniref:UDP-N-acetylmuramoyl-L-alanyl-D-glutamate--2,6-diaminopimelate ligase n=1 Tax=Gracilimonas mengyeensis TaxID=1302730 RepID=A0A521E1A7_9BACT|nr:UDP-N-acetylmuramoyl-L-alanyl-D-glutamate--2,6-diaminopimelate ligase [Gracilimonas mengyeensis]SMO77736.1 UDP-N-acetylmuramoylalanyl-D-glutamate--2,6-diaminopimelate ligase [Gracilimonas mengyeensis]